MVFSFILDWACSILEWYYFIKFVIWACYEIYPYVTKPYDLLARYGAGTWVAITGGSDGIGFAFAKEFARRGFNIVLIARTQSKLEASAKSL